MVEDLVDAQVHGARHTAHPLEQPIRVCRLPSTLKPVTWMSSGAGKPKFKIWLTMSAGG